MLDGERTAATPSMFSTSSKEDAEIWHAQLILCAFAEIWEVLKIELSTTSMQQIF
jgi:hypothetical protein